MLLDNYEEKKPLYYGQQTLLCIVSIDTSVYSFLVVIMDCLFSNPTTSFHHEIYSLIRKVMTHT